MFKITDPLLTVSLRHRFSDLFGGGQAVDRVRQQVIPNTPIELNVIG